MGKKEEKTNENEKAAKFTGVPFWKRFGKSSLRMWPSEAGDCIMTKEGRNKRKEAPFDEKHIEEQ